MIRDLLKDIETKGKALAAAAILSTALSALAALGITIVILKMIEHITVGSAAKLIWRKRIRQTACFIIVPWIRREPMVRM